MIYMMYQYPSMSYLMPSTSLHQSLPVQSHSSRNCQHRPPQSYTCITGTKIIFLIPHSYSIDLPTSRSTIHSTISYPFHLHNSKWQVLLPPRQQRRPKTIHHRYPRPIYKPFKRRRTALVPTDRHLPMRQTVMTHILTSTLRRPFYSWRCSQLTSWMLIINSGTSFVRMRWDGSINPLFHLRWALYPT